MGELEPSRSAVLASVPPPGSPRAAPSTLGSRGALSLPARQSEHALCWQTEPASASPPSESLQATQLLPKGAPQISAQPGGTCSQSQQAWIVFKKQQCSESILVLERYM